MSFVRLPRFLLGHAPLNEGALTFPDAVDLHPGDTVVFGDLSTATVNAVTYPTVGGTVVVLGKDPSCAPPKREKESREDADPGREAFVIAPEDVGTLELP